MVPQTTPEISLPEDGGACPQLSFSKKKLKNCDKYIVARV